MVLSVQALYLHTGVPQNMPIASNSTV